MNFQWNKDIVESLTAQHDFKLQVIQSYHLRISGGKFIGKLDYFPKSGRATIVGSQEWFVITDIEQYILKHFIN